MKRFMIALTALMFVTIGFAQHRATTVEAALVVVATANVYSTCDPVVDSILMMGARDIARGTGTILVDYGCQTYDGTYDYALVDEVFSHWESTGWNFGEEINYSVYGHVQRRDLLVVWVAPNFKSMVIGIFN